MFFTVPVAIRFSKIITDSKIYSIFCDLLEADRTCS